MEDKQVPQTPPNQEGVSRYHLQARAYLSRGLIDTHLYHYIYIYIYISLSLSLSLSGSPEDAIDHPTVGDTDHRTSVPETLDVTDGSSPRDTLCSDLVTDIQQK